ncbi:MAG: Flp pilus assembly protein CpaB [Bacillota bacterium]
MSKLPLKGLIGIALILSLATSVLVYQYLKGSSKTGLKADVPVVVAKVDIPAKTKITAEMVQEIRMPAEYIQPGTVTDLKSLLGIATREKIAAGEPITERRLFIEGKTVGFTGAIPPDKRAVTVAVTEVTGVAGFIKAGDFVDVIATFDKNDTGEHTSNLILQNVLVLAANRETEYSDGDTATKDKKDIVKMATVTLAVAPEQAAKLAVSEEKGKIRLALRPFLPDNDYAVAKAATPTELVGFHQPPMQLNQNNQQNRTASQDTRPAERVAEPPAPRQEPPTIVSGITVLHGTKMEIVPVH